MAEYESALSELSELLTGTDASLSTSLAEILATALQELIEAELTGRIGAAPGERVPTRTAQRNGHRSKLLSTPAGDVDVGIPKLRQGSFFPELLEPRRRIDKALWAVIMTAYITGTSTRKVDDLVNADAFVPCVTAAVPARRLASTSCASRWMTRSSSASRASPMTVCPDP